MIIGNELHFGHGSIAVTVRGWSYTIELEEIDPPSKVGAQISKESIFTGEKVSITITNWEELQNFKKLIKEKKKFIFRGFVFNYEEAKQNSKNVMLNAIERIESNIMRIMVA